MALYSTYVPPDGDVGKAIFLRDGLSLFGLVLPPLFLAWNRLWLALAAYLAFQIVLAALSLSGGSEVAAILAVLPGFFLLVHGQELRRNQLERKGWRDVGACVADTVEDAELRYFHRNANSDPVMSSVPAPANSPSTSGGQIKFAQQPLGLFPE
jgi:hypothetical protein